MPPRERTRAVWALAIIVGLIAASCATQPSHEKTALSDILSRTPGSERQPVKESENVTDRNLQVTYATLPLSFEPNQGQTNEQVHFLSRGRGYTLFLTSTEAVLALRTPPAAKASLDTKTPPIAAGVLASTFGHGTPDPGLVVRMQLLGANPNPQVAGQEDLPGKVNYFIGNDHEKWRTDISTYTKVRYQNVYPGVDLVYYGNQRQLEYDFVVSPGADPTGIKLAFHDRARQDIPFQINADGDLVLSPTEGEIHLRKPQMYQEIDGIKQPIAGRYVLFESETLHSELRARHVGFEVAAYDVNKPLIIDPVLSYSTYLGGSSNVSYIAVTDEGYGIAVDKAGSAYVTGHTISADFPTTPGAFDTTCGTDGTCNSTYPRPTFNGPTVDAFITKFTAAGSALVYSTYLGGTNFDVGNAIAVDPSGNAYVTGYTTSTDFSTANPTQASYRGGNSDAFVAKISEGAGSGQISLLFTSNRDGNYEIYSTNTDGTGLTNLTQNSANDFAPWANPWSPDGSQIAFVSDRDGHFEVYLMNADGTNQERVTFTDSAIAPAWAPNGQQLAFTVCSPTAAVCGIETINLDGTNDQTLIAGQDPEWSALNRIAFEKPLQDFGGVIVGFVVGIINPDGTGSVTVDADPSDHFDYNVSPRWSPDGQKLAFIHFTQCGTGCITAFYLVNQDGSNLTKLLDFPKDTQVDNLAWSPDGQKFAFSKNGGIYIINADGTGLQNVTPETVLITGTLDILPSWSPDGKQLTFASDRNSQGRIHDIFVINLDGSGEQNLTNSPNKDDSYPFWKPTSLPPLSTLRDIVFIRGINSNGDCIGAETWVEKYLKSPRGRSILGSVQINKYLHFNYRTGKSYTCRRKKSKPAYLPINTCGGVTMAANRLKTLIDQQDEKVTIVAHSMGGLVAAYLVGSQSVIDKGGWARSHIASVITFDGTLKGGGSETDIVLFAAAAATANPPLFGSPVCQFTTANHQSLTDLISTSEVVQGAAGAAKIVPFYPLHAIESIVLPGLPFLVLLSRDESTLEQARAFFPSTDSCNLPKADQSTCEPPASEFDDHFSIWNNRRDHRPPIEFHDKGFLVACAIVSPAGDCTFLTPPLSQ